MSVMVVRAVTAADTPSMAGTTALTTSWRVVAPIAAGADPGPVVTGTKLVGPEGVEPCKVDHRKYRAMPWRA